MGYLFVYSSLAVNHLEYLGVQVAWISGPWFLSIFVNMLPWESGEDFLSNFSVYQASFMQITFTLFTL